MKYYEHKSGLCCNDFKHYLPSSLGDALKYVWRAGKKLYPGKDETESALADLDKASDYLNLCQTKGLPKYDKEYQKELYIKLSALEKQFTGDKDIKDLTNREILIRDIIFEDSIFIIEDVRDYKAMIKDKGADWLEQKVGYKELNTPYFTE